MTRRKAGPIPIYARNQSELGQYLMPPRDRKIIQRAMKMEGNPGKTPDNRYEILPWNRFVNEKFKASAERRLDPDLPDKRRLEEEKLKLQNEKLEFQIAVMRREYTANAEIKITAGKVFMEVSRSLSSLPGKAAPIVIGLDEVGAEAYLKEEIRAALSGLAAWAARGGTADAGGNEYVPPPQPTAPTNPVDDETDEPTNNETPTPSAT